MSINFILPGLYEHYELNFKFLDLYKNHPEYFIDNVKISAVYGSFQFCIFDGGRIFSCYRHTTKEEIEKITNIYNNQYQTPMRLVLTNPILQPQHFYNRFGNLILTLCEKDMNEIVINNPQFEEYVRMTYPKYTFISSTTKCLSTPKELKDELNKTEYKMVCLDYNLNKNKKLLEEIPLELRSKCEFLVNAICGPGCPQRKDHYKLNGLFHLTYGKPYSLETCQITNNTLHPTLLNNQNNLTPQEIYEEYVPMGYNLFKIEGRTLSLSENACNYVRYMIKPEYQWFVLNQLLDTSGQQKIFLNKLPNE